LANPQKENGFTPIANETIDAISKARIPGEELRILLHIFRMTYGYSRKECTLSYAEISKATGIDRRRLTSLIGRLSSKMVIAVTKNGDRAPQTFKFNKNYDEWVTRDKKSTVTINGDKVVTINGDREKVLPLYERKKEIMRRAFVLKDGSEFEIDDEFYAILKETYPSIDIENEIRKIKSWCHSNPSKRKTRKGAKRFVNGWMANVKKPRNSKTPDWL
jgi:phage replication O-like protein O